MGNKCICYSNIVSELDSREENIRLIKKWIMGRFLNNFFDGKRKKGRGKRDRTGDWEENIQVDIDNDQSGDY